MSKFLRDVFGYLFKSNAGEFGDGMNIWRDGSGKGLPGLPCAISPLRRERDPLGDGYLTGESAGEVSIHVAREFAVAPGDLVWLGVPLDSAPGRFPSGAVRYQVTSVSAAPVHSHWRIQARPH